MAEDDVTALLAIDFVPDLRNAATASRPEIRGSKLTPRRL